MPIGSSARDATAISRPRPASDARLRPECSAQHHLHLGHQRPAQGRPPHVRQSLVERGRLGAQPGHAARRPLAGLPAAVSRRRAGHPAAQRHLRHRGRRPRALRPDCVNHAIDHERVTIVSVVSTMLERMLAQRGEQPYPATLRCVLLGGGPAPLPLLERALALGVPVVQSYGLTETASQVATLAPEDARSKIGSAGKPLMGTAGAHRARRRDPGPRTRQSAPATCTSRRTASGCAPATWATWTTRATCTCSTGATT